MKQSKHHHINKHDHEHHHGQSAGLFFLGLFTLVLAFLVEKSYPLVACGLFLTTVITTGQHVMSEGLIETIQETRTAKKFQPNVHFLMTLATIGAILIGHFEEAALLIAIFASAHYLEEYVEGKSRREITKLLSMQPKVAQRIQPDGSIEEVAVEELQIGQLIQVLNGSQIPSDGIIRSGSTAVNEAAVNGESMPKEKTVGDEVFAGTMNEVATIQVEVTKAQSDTVFAKIIDLVNQSQQSLTKTASLIKQLEPKYVTIVLGLFPLVVLFGIYGLGWSVSTAFYRGMVYLIAVSPCALAASAIPATLAAISYLSKQGVLVKGGSYLSLLSDLSAIAFDKTGTLTTGNPQVVALEFLDTNKEEWLNILVAMEKQANHPLAKAIARDITITEKVIVETQFEVGVGIFTEYQRHHYRVAKPSAFTLSPKWQQIVTEWSRQGKTVVLMAEDEQIIGGVALLDVAKDQTNDVIRYFKQANVHTTLITGDSVETGEAIAQAIGVDEVIANVLPEDKAHLIRMHQAKYGVTAMVGDGINDTPALASADIGIGMGNGTDVAVEFSDLVLMDDDLNKLTLAHQVAKKMTRITWQNIIFAMGVVVTLVLFNFFEISNITMGIILHEGSTVLVIVNALRMLLPLKM